MYIIDNHRQMKIPKEFLGQSKIFKRGNTFVSIKAAVTAHFIFTLLRKKLKRNIYNPPKL